MPVIVAVIAFVATALLLIAGAMRAEERLGVRLARRRLGDYGSPVLQSEAELQEPLTDRVLRPSAAYLMGLITRFVPPVYVEKVHHRLVLAGRGKVEDLERFLIIRVLMLVAVPVGLLVLWLLPLHGTVLIATMVFVVMVGAFGPSAWLDRVIQHRQFEIRRKLPDLLDLLTISIEAGLGFDQALGRASTMMAGPLSEEFQRTLGELRAGASRADALRGLDRRTEVQELRSFILALLQADTFGVSVGSILRTQASDMRVRRHQFAQEQAQKAPVKMLFPMVFCIMPALFVVIAGPAALSIYHLFAGH